MRHRQHIEIDRPVETVFEYLTDPSRLPEWDTDVRCGRVLSDGGMGVGARIEIERTVPPTRRYATLRGRVIQYEPRSTFAVDIDEGPLPFHLRYAFEHAPRGTVVDVAIESRPVGSRRLIEVLATPLIHRQVSAHYRSLKRVLEQSVDAG